MLYTLSVAGGIWSIRFAQLKDFMPLFPLLVAPSCSLVAHFFVEALRRCTTFLKGTGLVAKSVSTPEPESSQSSGG